ncbi:MAG TPA: NfeD family protein [Vulgatibacter sp.]|nr:NfeD family protein [Vulgatibacter sp.]
MSSLDSYLPTHAYQLWLALAILLGIAETLTGGFFIVMFSAGCVVASGLAYFGASFNTQLGAFIATSFVLLALSRTLFRKYLATRSSDVRTNADAIIGREAEVTDAIGPGAKRGLVRLGGETWSAAADVPIDVGERVRVEAIEGLTLRVNRIPGARREGVGR